MLALLRGGRERLEHLGLGRFSTFCGLDRLALRLFTLSGQAGLALGLDTGRLLALALLLLACAQVRLLFVFWWDEPGRPGACGGKGGHMRRGEFFFPTVLQRRCGCGIRRVERML